MKHPGSIKIEAYDYELADSQIARYPLETRDTARLLVYKNGAITEDTYRDLGSQLPPDTFLVFNQTKVIHARLLFQKTTGGVIEIFCLEPHTKYGEVQEAMRQQNQVWWQCMIGGASKWKHGMVLERSFEHYDLQLRAAIVERLSGSYTIEFTWTASKCLSFGEVLEIAGEVPLPPYLQRKAEEGDERRYQTVYAREEGSVAAPTAGLHFTEALLEDLDNRGIGRGFVTLHVGAGTFKPVSAEELAEHEMHAEWIDVSIDLIQKLAQQTGPVVAVGTTSLRTIESLYWIGQKLLNHIVPVTGGVAVGQWDPYDTEGATPSAQDALTALADWLLQNHLDRLVVKTQILIAPGYQFKMATGLITNFHQPRSTLLLLVAAMIGDDWHRVYDYALNNGFRFLSFGDGSLLWARHANDKLI